MNLAIGFNFITADEAVKMIINDAFPSEYKSIHDHEEISISKETIFLALQVCQKLISYDEAFKKCLR